MIGKLSLVFGAVVLTVINGQDTNMMCQPWAQRNECQMNPAFMLMACPQSCSGAQPQQQLVQQSL